MTWDEFYESFKNSNDLRDLESGYNQTQTQLQQNLAAEIARQNDIYNQSKGDMEVMKAKDIEALNTSRDYSLGLLNKQNQRSQGEAYVGYKQNQKSLPLIMATKGINGGASESSISDMQRRYENARINNDAVLQNETGSLMQDYNTNFHDTSQSYSSKLSQLLYGHNSSLNNYQTKYLDNMLNAQNEFNNSKYTRGQNAYKAEIQRLQEIEDQRQWQTQFDFEQRQYADKQAYDAAVLAAKQAPKSTASSKKTSSKKTSSSAKKSDTTPKNNSYVEVYGQKYIWNSAKGKYVSL